MDIITTSFNIRPGSTRHIILSNIRKEVLKLEDLRAAENVNAFKSRLKTLDTLFIPALLKCDVFIDFSNIY